MRPATSNSRITKGRRPEWPQLTIHRRPESRRGWQVSSWFSRSSSSRALRWCTKAGPPNRQRVNFGGLRQACASSQGQSASTILFLHYSHTPLRFLHTPTVASSLRSHMNHFFCLYTASPNSRMNLMSASSSGPLCTAAMFSRSSRSFRGAVRTACTWGFERTNL